MRRLATYIIGLMLIGWFMQPTPVAQATAVTGWYNNNDPEVHYSANSGQDWGYQNGSTYSLAMNSDISTTTTPGARIDFTFSGSSVTYWYTMAYNRGNYKVYMDGIYIEQISANTSGVKRQIGRTWTVPNPNYYHTLSIIFVPTPSGTILDIDAFSVNVQTYNIGTDGDNNDPAIRRFGTWLQGTNSGTYATSLIWSDIQGSFVRYTFSGDVVRYVFSKGRNYGIAQVYIDGVFRRSVDQYADVDTPIRQQSVLMLSSDRVYPLFDQGLPSWVSPNGVRNDTHIIDIYVSGSKAPSSQGTFIDVDRIYSKQDYLPISYIPQYQTNWCWADVSQVVGQYMTASKMSSTVNDNNRQCELVKLRRGGSCPNVSGDLIDIGDLLGYQYDSHYTNFLGTLSSNDVRQNLLSKQPIIERWSWPIGDPAEGHFVIINGINDELGTYRIQVPRDVGVTTETSIDLTYAQLLSGHDTLANKDYFWNGYIAWIYR